MRLWRGQGDATWNLVPSIFRDSARIWLNQHLNFSDELLKQEGYQNALPKAERSVIGFFILNADRTGIALPNFNKNLMLHLYQSDIHYDDPFPQWPTEDDYEIIATAQHYEHPTRMIDWSTSPLIGLYFAVNGFLKEYAKRTEDPPTEYALWSLNTAVNTNLSGEDNRNDFIRSRIVRPVEIPYRENKYLRAQSGKFTLCTDTLAKSWDGTKDGIEKYFPEDTPDCRLTKYLLPADSIGSANRILENLNVSALQVFPGYRGVLQSLTEAKLYNRFIDETR